MTTIVVDREMGYMAADRMATTNDCEVAIVCPKIRRIDGVGLVASSGSEGPALLVEDWLENGEWDEPLDPIEVDEDNDFTTIFLTDESEIFVVDKFCRPYAVETRWYATGSGGIIALSILEAGCGIEKAMETAQRLDPNSGLGYDVVHLT